jgi:hypothetical protein
VDPVVELWRFRDWLPPDNARSVDPEWVCIWRRRPRRLTRMPNELLGRAGADLALRVADNTSR